MSWRIGVDIGGTFTDVVLADEASGAAAVVKVPTTPRDFAHGVMEGLRVALSGHGVAAAAVGWLGHATTVVTNALLQGKGARVALITKGGFGARPTKDGITGVASGISNTMNTPIEVLEMSFPVRVERYAIVPDTGGPGRFRGGCGVERVWRILGQPAHASVCLERTKSAPFGLAGGGAGAPGRIAVGGTDGSERELVSKGAFAAAPDTEVHLRAPGAGGYGDPAARDREPLRDDVVNGYVSPAAAAAAYGRRDASELTCPACRPGSA